jgi:alkylation response protein AidB-like acyl-CoA dehydrogenase
MDLGFKRYQETLRRTARAYLEKACSLENLRAADASEAGFSLDHYREMAQLGWFALALPACDGGGEDDFLNQMLLYEEFGRAALPGPHFVSTVLAAQLIARQGSDAQKALLADLAGGERIATVAIYEETADYTPEAVQLRAERQPGGGFRLTGRKLFVPYAQVADPLLVLARSGEAPEALSWLLVSTRASGLALHPLETLSGERQYEVELNGVEVPDTALLGGEGSGWAALQASYPLATVLQSAELVGLADMALEIAVEYAKIRVAFGRPIGSFQAIQHMAADMLADRDGARYLTYQAACLVNQGEGRRAEIAMTKAFAATAGRQVTKLAHEILAGVGYTLDHRLHYYYRRAKGIELALGDADEQLELVAGKLGL